jgi:hypothetical protein
MVLYCSADVLNKLHSLTHLRKCVPGLFKPGAINWDVARTAPSDALRDFQLHKRMDNETSFLLVRASLVG